jgi:hypothetical protein
MQFIKIGEYLAASRIAGPKHNLLQLRLAKSADEKLEVQCLPPQGGCAHGPLDRQALTEAVLEGVAEANKELGTSYAVSGIKYVQNDTKPEIVYGHIALSILRNLHANGSFTEAPPEMLRELE